MCGRYATTRSAADLSALFECTDETGGSLAPDYNVAPTDRVPIVRISRHLAGPALSVASWGLVPTWAKDTKGAARMINARAETVASGKAYASSFARRRCLVPADGWYEWVRRDGAGTGTGRAVKQAYFMTPRDGGPLAFAGLWSAWNGGAGPLLTCSVVTTPATGDLALVHGRMPLLLPPQRWADWLGGGGDPAQLLRPASDEYLAGIEMRAVGPAVGDVRNDGPELVAPVPGAPLPGPMEQPVELTLF